MAKKMGADDTIGNKIDRFKGKAGSIEIIRVVKSIIDGEEGFFWRVPSYTGKRPDGTQWFVNAHDDDSQNYGAEIGGQFREACACIVVHAGTWNMSGRDSMLIGRVKAWIFGADKWVGIQNIGVDVASKVELAITTKEEQYQDLTIIPCPPERRLLGKLSAESQAALKIALPDFAKKFAEFIKPHTRDEQMKIVAGRDGDQGGGASYNRNQLTGGGRQQTGMQTRGGQRRPSTPAPDDLFNDGGGSGSDPAYDDTGIPFDAPTTTVGGKSSVGKSATKPQDDDAALDELFSRVENNTVVVTKDADGDPVDVDGHVVEDDDPLFDGTGDPKFY